MDELQLHDLQNADAADPPMQRRHPETSDDPMAPTPPVKSGMERRAPMIATERWRGMRLASNV